MIHYTAVLSSSGIQKHLLGYNSFFECDRVDKGVNTLNNVLAVS